MNPGLLALVQPLRSGWRPLQRLKFRSIRFKVVEVMKADGMCLNLTGGSNHQSVLDASFNFIHSLFVPQSGQDVNLLNINQQTFQAFQAVKNCAQGNDRTG